MTLTIEVERVEYQEVEAMRELYRHEAHCQIIYDSSLRRGMADPYVIVVEGRRAGMRQRPDIVALLKHADAKEPGKRP